MFDALQIIFGLLLIFAVIWIVICIIGVISLIIKCLPLIFLVIIGIVVYKLFKPSKR